MVTPTFGFSAGDFISAINLLRKAADALRETSGAAEQFQHAAVELNILQRMLVRVKSLEPRASQSAEIVEHIGFYSHLCYAPLARFINKVKRFERHLRQDLRSNRTKDAIGHVSKAGRTIQWAICLEKELGSLKNSIGPFFGVI